MANKARKIYAKKSPIVAADGMFLGVQFAFTNGSTLKWMLTDAPQMNDQAACHGYSQKFGDSYNTADSAEKAHESCKTLMEQVKGGNWKSGERGFAINLDDLARAICEIKGGSIIDAKEKLTAAPKEKVKELAAVPKLKALMQKYKLERLADEAEESEVEFDL
jgi:hypothetical protein